MKPIIIIAIAFVLLIPISVLGQEDVVIKAQEQFEQKYGTFEELQQEGKDVIKNIPVEKIENKEKK